MRARPRPAAEGARPGRLRIIGGRFKRTPLTVVDAPGLRPTPDRVRETLFNWLGPDLEGRRVLDVFAGTGALGLEALSRGAREVVFVESNPRARQAIEALLTRLDAGAQARVIGGDALVALPRLASGPQARFDLVLLDPPFGQGWLAKILPKVGPLLAPAARLYVESPEALDAAALVHLFGAADGTPIPSGVRADKAGQVHYHLFNFSPD